MEIKNEPISILKLHNPTAEDLHFMYDSAPYAVKAGETEQWTKVIVLHGAKKLADKNVMTNDPSEHKVLFNAYSQNSNIEDVAKSLKVDLAKIRAEAMTKEKEKARMTNVEAELMRMREEMAELKKVKEEPKKQEVNVSAEEAGEPQIKVEKPVANKKAGRPKKEK